MPLRPSTRDARGALLLLLLCAFSAALLSVDAVTSSAASSSGGADSCDLGSHTIALDMATRALTITRTASSSSSSLSATKQLVLSASAPFVRAQCGRQRVQQWSGDFVVDNAAPALASDDQARRRRDPSRFKTCNQFTVRMFFLSSLNAFLSNDPKQNSVPASVALYHVLRNAEKSCSQRSFF